MLITQTEEQFKAKSNTAICRSCGSQGLLPVLDLGSMPLSDGLLTSEQLKRDEAKYPLELVFCPECSLVQILETVDPNELFCDDYPYYSSFSDALLKHSRENALSLIHSRDLTSDSYVVELASNDGYLLKNFVENDIPVQGIDPAEGPAKAAEKIGVPTINTFFTKELAQKLVSEGKQADVIIGNNVLAHVPDTNGFVEGIGILLKENGVAVIEVPYLCDLIEHTEFDTIYHEHLCYFSVTALDNLFRRHNLYLNDIKRLTIHGGSLRLFVEKHESPTDNVTSLLQRENDFGLDSEEYYKNFSHQVQAVRSEMNNIIDKIKSEGKTIAAYGAAAKGAIMVNYIQAGTDKIDFVVDRNVHKQGKFMPGMHIPIYDPAKILEDMPDYVIILPWNFKDEIMSQQKQYRERGGKFIIPIPKPVIV